MLDPILALLWPADFHWIDTLVVTPAAGLIDRFISVPDIFDFVTWFPRLTWKEVFGAAVLIIICNAITSAIDHLIWRHVRFWIAARLVDLADLIRPAPRLASRVGNGPWHAHPLDTSTGAA